MFRRVGGARAQDRERGGVPVVRLHGDQGRQLLALLRGAGVQRAGGARGRGARQLAALCAPLSPRDPKTALFCISFLRKGEVLAYVGSI